MARNPKLHVRGEAYLDNEKQATNANLKSKFAHKPNVVFQKFI
jgi:hypothetical protein